MPLVWVQSRVDPIVKLSSSLKVPPAPLKVRGLSKVFPAVVISWVPDVAPKIMGSVPAAMVMPEDRIRFP